ncbi:MAG: 3-oxoacyl-[acyl-carrier-protein] synthase III C-terminal domain-containing protein, partial [Litorimonas sp.]
VFKATSRRFPGFLKSLLKQAQIQLTDINSIIPHQASAPALEFLKRAVPNGREKVVDIFSDYGNQIAVSIPHALHIARQTDRTGPGSTSLLIGSSAGISLGGGIIKW